MNLRELMTTSLSCGDKFRVAKALCMAVDVLHNELPSSIVHRDLRLDNVLLMPDGRICIADLGLARNKNKETKSKRSVGSSVHTLNKLTTMQPYEIQCLFSNPDEKTNHGYSHSGDVFMLGCMLAHLYTGREAFNDLTIQGRKAPDLGTELKISDPWLHDLLAAMLAHDRYARPPIAMVLRHPYFLSPLKNFDGNLIGKIERVIVNDSNPIDTEAFRQLERLLKPIEERCTSTNDSSQWFKPSSDGNQTGLPLSIFDGIRHLPFTRNPLVLRPIPQGGVRARPYPLPRVAQLVKWLRNIHTHFQSDDELQHIMCTSSCSTPYTTPGEFFMKHPSVCWLLPRVWEEVVKQAREIETKRRSILEELEKLDEDYDNCCSMNLLQS